MATAQNVIDRVKLDFSSVPPAVILAELNVVHTELLFDIKLTADTETITMTAGTGSYALDADILRVWSARYESAANTFKPLVPTHLDEMDHLFPRWRTTAYAQGTPSHFYIDTTNIWLYPWPSTTASGGYPRIVLEVSRSVALSVGTSLPTQANLTTAWEAGVMRRLARRMKDERLSYYDAEYEREMNKLRRLIDERNVRYKTRILPGMVSGGLGKI